MFTEKEIEKINRFLSNQTFECTSNLFGSWDASEFNFEYQFAITGIKQMISVGDLHDNVKVYVEITDIEDRYKLFYGIMGRGYSREQLTNIFFKKEYIFTHSLNRCISDTLKHFTSDQFVRIFFDNVIISDNLYNEIKNTQDTA